MKLLIVKRSNDPLLGPMVCSPTLGRRAGWSQMGAGDLSLLV